MKREDEEKVSTFQSLKVRRYASVSGVIETLKH